MIIKQKTLKTYFSVAVFDPGDIIAPSETQFQYPAHIMPFSASSNHLSVRIASDLAFDRDTCISSRRPNNASAPPSCWVLDRYKCVGGTGSDPSCMTGLTAVNRHGSIAAVSFRDWIL